MNAYFSTAITTLTMAIALSAHAADSALIIDNTDLMFGSEKNMGASIFLYHALTDEYADKTFDKQIFVDHIKWLHDNNFESITLKQLSDWITSGTPALPVKPILFAFDDNYLTVYTVAFPTLKRFGFFGYNFVHSKYVGVKTQWEHTTWEQINEMEKDGTILTESHTVTHTALPTLDNDNMTTELTWSKRDIEAHIPGKTVRYLSIPYSQIDDRVIPAARAAGYEACILGSGPENTRDTDIFLLTHFGMNPEPNCGVDVIEKCAQKGLNTGTWETTKLKGCIGKDCAIMPAGDGTATACWQWTPNNTTKYRIEIRIPAENVGAATNATYTIKHKDGISTATVNQAGQQNAGKWIPLGTYEFAKDKSAYIAVNNKTDGNIIADAIRITKTTK